MRLLTILLLALLLTGCKSDPKPDPAPAPKCGCCEEVDGKCKCEYCNCAKGEECFCTKDKCDARKCKCGKWKKDKKCGCPTCNGECEKGRGKCCCKEFTDCMDKDGCNCWCGGK